MTYRPTYLHAVDVSVGAGGGARDEHGPTQRTINLIIMTFAADWVLKANYLSIYLLQS